MKTIFTKWMAFSLLSLVMAILLLTVDSHNVTNHNIGLFIFWFVNAVLFGVVHELEVSKN